MSLSKPIGRWSEKGVSGEVGACVSFFSLAASLCGNIGGDRDAPVIHMGMIVGMRGVSIRMRPLKGGDDRGSDDEEAEASERRFHDLRGGVRYRGKGVRFGWLRGNKRTGRTFPT